MKTLIVYYSQARGNTRRISKMIQKAIGADIAEIKTVVPFITHGGWPAHAVSDMIDGLNGAKIENEKEIQFDSTGGDELVTEQAEIDAWISRLT